MSKRKKPHRFRFVRSSHDFVETRHFSRSFLAVDKFLDISGLSAVAFFISKVNLFIFSRGRAPASIFHGGKAGFRPGSEFLERPSIIRVVKIIWILEENILPKRRYSHAFESSADHTRRRYHELNETRYGSLEVSFLVNVSTTWKASFLSLKEQESHPDLILSRNLLNLKPSTLVY